MAETETKSSSTSPSPSTEVEEMARTYFDAVSRRDLEAMASHWDPEVILDLVPVGVQRGAGEYRAFFEQFFAAMPDSQFHINRITGNDAVAAVEWRLTGTFSGGSFQGIEPTGKEVQVRGCDCLEFKDGKIVKNTAYYDGMEFARSIGMLPSQDSGAERAIFGAFNAVTKVRKAVQERGK